MYVRIDFCCMHHFERPRMYKSIAQGLETQKFGTWEPLKHTKKTYFSWLQKKYNRLNQQNFMPPRTLTNRYPKSSPKLEARRYIICGKSVLFSFPGCVNLVTLVTKFDHQKKSGDDFDVFFCMAWIGAVLVPGSRSSSAVLSWSH